MIPELAFLSQTTLDEYLIATAVGLVAGYILRAKKWWGEKDAEQKLEFIEDTIDIFSDGKITAEELKTILNKHIFCKKD